MKNKSNLQRRGQESLKKIEGNYAAEVLAEYASAKKKVKDSKK